MKDLVTQASAFPTRKVGAVGAGGALVTVVLWILGFFEVEVPAEVGAALATLLSFVAGYFVRDYDNTP